MGGPSTRLPIPQACGIPACARCDEDAGKCVQCVSVPDWIAWLPTRSFRISPEGECYLAFEHYFEVAGWVLLCAIVAILVLAAIAQFVLVRCKVKESFKGKGKSQDVQQLSLYRSVFAEGVSLLAGDSPQGPMGKQEMVRLSKESISHGLTSWLQRQMRDWELKSGPEPTRYPLKTDLSKKFVIGVGLPLFHGFQALVGGSAALAAVVLFVAQHSSGLEGVMHGLFRHFQGHIDESADPHISGPALPRYAVNMFYATGLMYTLLLALAYRYSKFQRGFVRLFDVNNSCMSDYTMHLEGLPTNLTAEGELKEIIEKEFGCQGKTLGVSIAYDLVNDQELRGKVSDICENITVRADVDFSRGDTVLSSEGWGYDEQLARKEALDDDRDKKEFLRLFKDEKRFAGSGHAFVVFKNKSDRDAVVLKYRGIWLEAEVTPKSEEEVQAIKEALGGKCAFPGDHVIDSVEDFVPSVANTLRTPTIDKQRGKLASRLCKKVVVGHERLEEGTKIFNTEQVAVGRPLTVERLVKVLANKLEPTSTEFWSFGKTPLERQRSANAAVCTVFLVFLAIVVLVYTPFWYWLTMPHALAQTSPSVMASQLQGIILGIAGNVLGTVNWNSVSSIGDYAKPDRDLHFVTYSTFTSFFNTFTGLGTTMYVFIENGFNKVDLTEDGDVSPAVLLREWQLFRNFYDILMPGWLFSGVVTGKLMGWFMPLLQNFLLLNVVFTLRCLPSNINRILCAIIPWSPPPDWLSARAAEHVFEPPEVALAWEYAQYIVTPSVCCFSLFMLSAGVWKVFAFLAGWGFFMYLLHRFPTLLISKKQMASSVHVEQLAEKLWGIPLAIVLAAFGFWGVRCEKLGNPQHGSSYWIVFFMFLLGLLVHMLMLLTMDHYEKPVFDISDQPYEEIERKLRYTWFNCNPVHVLKSRYCPQELGDVPRSAVLFEYGKEYLQVRDLVEMHTGLRVRDTEDPAPGSVRVVNCCPGT